MSANSKATIKNRLLAALPEKPYQRLQPHLEPFAFEHAKILYEIGEPIKYCYFPSDAVVSLVTQMEDGKIVEVGLVGNEGVTGLPFLLGQKKSAERAIVQIPNGGMRVKAAVILDEFNIALQQEYVAVSDVLPVLRARPPAQHVVITGRGAKQEIIDEADLVTEMGQVKHPFRKGIKAQKGVEF